jgi:hypothetical protein
VHCKCKPLPGQKRNLKFEYWSAGCADPGIIIPGASGIVGALRQEMAPLVWPCLTF